VLLKYFGALNLLTYLAVISTPSPFMVWQLVLGLVCPCTTPSHNFEKVSILMASFEGHRLASNNSSQAVTAKLLRERERERERRKKEKERKREKER
jgi:hypothetical protein